MIRTFSITQTSEGASDSTWFFLMPSIWAPLRCTARKVDIARGITHGIAKSITKGLSKGLSKGITKEIARRALVEDLSQQAFGRTYLLVSANSLLRALRELDRVLPRERT